MPTRATHPYSLNPNKPPLSVRPQKTRPVVRQPKTIPPTRSSTPPLGSISEFYELGSKFLEATGGERSPGMAKELSKESGYSEVAVYKARQFAKMYNQDELEELCSLGESEGQPLGIGHVHQLIQIKGAGERKRLQKAASKNCWSSRKLKEKRKHKLGYQVATNVGRKPRRAANSDEALLQLAQHADQWMRWADALATTLPEEDQSTQFTLGDLKDSVRDRLKAVTHAMQELAATLQRLNFRKKNSQQAQPKKKR